MTTIHYKPLSWPPASARSKDWVEVPTKPGANFISYWRYNYRGEPVCVDTKPLQKQPHLSMSDYDFIMKDFYNEKQ